MTSGFKRRLNSGLMVKLTQAFPNQRLAIQGAIEINMDASKKTESFKELIILIVSFLLFALVYAETKSFYF